MTMKKMVNKLSLVLICATSALNAWPSLPTKEACKAYLFVSKEKIKQHPYVATAGFLTCGTVAGATVAYYRIRCQQQRPTQPKSRDGLEEESFCSMGADAQCGFGAGASAVVECDQNGMPKDMGIERDGEDGKEIFFDAVESHDKK